MTPMTTKPGKYQSVRHPRHSAPASSPESTQNPNWWKASDASGLIPRTLDPHGRGERMVRLVGNFLLTQGEFAGLRLGVVMLPWQRAYLRTLFGMTDEHGHRRVRRSFLKIGKGSSKTVLCAAVALGFVMDCVQRGVGTRGLVVILSPSVSTSNIMFGHIEAAILNDPHLSDQFRSKSINRTLTHVASGIEICVRVASLEQTVSLRPLLVLIDELHLLALECARADVVLDQLRKGMANAGHEALEIAISTAPPITATGVYQRTLDYARKVRDGVIADESYLPVLFEPPLQQFPDLDLSDSTNWWWSMPSLQMPGSNIGTMPVSELRREWDDVRRTGDPGAMALLLSQRHGIEPADRQNVGQLIVQERWASFATCERQPRTASEVITMAFDPSSGVDDPFAVATCWQEDGQMCFVVMQHLTRLGYDRARSGLRMVYDAAIAVGELVIHDTAEAMVGRVCQDAIALRDARTSAVHFGGDQHGLGGFLNTFTAATGAEFMPIKQGWPLLASLNDLEALAADMRIAHVHTPLLRANIANLTTQDGAYGRRFAKCDSDTSGMGQLKIDGAMALLSALALYEMRAHETLDVRALIG